MRSTDFPFAVMPQRLQRGGRPDYSAPSADVADLLDPTGIVGRGRLESRETSLREKLEDKLAVRFGRRNAEQMIQVLDFTPLAGAFVGNEAALAVRKGKRGEAAANVALAALPLPGAGKAAKKVAKAAAPDFSEGFGTFKSGPTKIIWEDNKDGTIELISLRTPAAKRGQGSARNAMQEFLAEADARGLNVSLGASPLDERTKSNRLVDFYKSLGFEPTGRRINMAGDPAMLRKAASAVEKSMAVNPTKKIAGKSLAVNPVKKVAAQNKPTSVGALKDIRPSTDDVYEVMEANTTAGRVTGDKMMPIDKLTGGVTTAADDARRVDQLVEAMSSPEGYVSRLIVDDAGNVIEGQHRLEALRRMGVSEVPVTQYVDLERAVPFSAMRDAAAAQNIHPDQANQIAKQLAEIYADEGGKMAEVLQYSAPKGFEKAWEAAIDAMSSAATKARGGFAVKKGR